MTALPTVSVIIPCLNRAHFLVPTIESVLKQDYPNIECIVVDGGSTDNTLEILERYRSSLQWMSEPDHGHADAINKRWKMSRGEILAWLNADDVWVIPSAVSQAVAYLQAHPEVDVVYGDCGCIDVNGNQIGMSYLHEWDLEYAVEHCDHCIPQPAAFIRRRILEKVGWLDTTYISKKDHELWLRIGLVGVIRHIPVLLAHARAAPGYLAKRGDITAHACVAMARKLFTLPNVPESLQAKKRRAMSNAYLRGIEYAWAGERHWSIIFLYALRALLADPSNALRVFKCLKSYAERSAPDDSRLRWLLIIFALLNIPRRTWHEVRSTLNLCQSLSPEQGIHAGRNLSGDRDIEWSWVAAQMPSGPGEALDFGHGGSHLGLIAAQRGFNVTAVDLEPARWFYQHPCLRFIQGDILRLPLPAGHFDLVINCSTVEHVGLVGRYGVIGGRHVIQKIKRGGRRIIRGLRTGAGRLFSSATFNPATHGLYELKREIVVPRGQAIYDPHVFGRYDLAFQRVVSKCEGSPPDLFNWDVLIMETQRYVLTSPVKLDTDRYAEALSLLQPGTGIRLDACTSQPLDRVRQQIQPWDTSTCPLTNMGTDQW